MFIISNQKIVPETMHLVLNQICYLFYINNVKIKNLFIRFEFKIQPK